MGTYSFGEYLEVFGGWPDPDEVVPTLDEADALRDDALDRRMDRYPADRDRAIEGQIIYGRGGRRCRRRSA